MASDGVNDFGWRQGERVHPEVPWQLGFELARSAGPLRRMSAGGFRDCGYATVSRLGSRFALVALSVRRRCTRPQSRSGCFESAASNPICPGQPIQSRLHRDSAHIHTCAQDPEVLNIVNWPDVISSAVRLLEPYPSGAVSNSMSE